MATQNPKSERNLVEQRNNVQTAMAKALSDNNMAEYHRLNGHLVYLEEKIRKQKENENGHDI